MCKGLRTLLILAATFYGIVAIGRAADPAVAKAYSTCKTWQEVVDGNNFRYADIIRISEPGTKEHPVYTGYWFFDGQQFDESGRYALAMKVDFQNRDVTPS